MNSCGPDRPALRSRQVYKSRDWNGPPASLRDLSRDSAGRGNSPFPRVKFRPSWELVCLPFTDTINYQKEQKIAACRDGLSGWPLGSRIRKGSNRRTGINVKSLLSIAKNLVPPSIGSEVQCAVQRRRYKGEGLESY